MDAFESMDDKQDLIECNTCGRSFNNKALERHRNVCKKNSVKPRKLFDASKQRQIENETAPMGFKSKTKAKPTAVRSTPNKVNEKTSQWKKKHEEFISTIRSARHTTALLAAGKPLPPPPPPAENPDYVRCQYCDRRFNEKAAQRHIPYCKEKMGRVPVTKTITPNAKLRNDARTLYKAPKLRKAADNSEWEQRSAKPTHSASRTSQSSYSASRTTSQTSPPDPMLKSAPIGTQRRLSSKHCSGEYSRKTTSGNSQKKNTFCHECGNQYVVLSAKFCCECGVKRLTMTS